MYDRSGIGVGRPRTHYVKDLLCTVVGVLLKGLTFGACCVLLVSGSRVYTMYYVLRVFSRSPIGMGRPRTQYVKDLQCTVRIM